MTLAWRSPVAFDAETIAAMVREALDGLGYRYSRKRGERTFGDTVSLDPNDKGTPAWRFFVESPAEFTVEAYNTKPRPQAVLGVLEVHPFRPDAEPTVRRLLQRVLETAPRQPWSFDLDQRLRAGPFNPAYREARRAWKPVAADEPLVVG